MHKHTDTSASRANAEGRPHRTPTHTYHLAWRTIWQGAMQVEHPKMHAHRTAFRISACRTYGASAWRPYTPHPHPTATISQRANRWAWRTHWQGGQTTSPCACLVHRMDTMRAARARMPAHAHSARSARWDTADRPSHCTRTLDEGVPPATCHLVANPRGARTPPRLAWAVGLRVHCTTARMARMARACASAHHPALSRSASQEQHTLCSTSPSARYSCTSSHSHAVL